MLKYFLILVGLCVSFPLYAMDAEDDDMNVVIFSPKEEEQSKNLYLPTCDEQAMINMVSDQIREYQETYPVYGIINRRKQILLLKNVKNFQEVAVSDFDNKKNPEVARQILKNNINLNIAKENMRLCRSSSGIYLLIYPEGNGYRVQIINLKKKVYSEDTLSVFYIRADHKKDDEEIISDTEDFQTENNTKISEKSIETVVTTEKNSDRESAIE